MEGRASLPGDSDLKVLKLQETGSFENEDKKSKGYDAAKVLAFLGAWALPKA